MSDNQGGYRIQDVASGRVLDWQCRKAPSKTVVALRNAGVTRFSFNGSIDWHIVEADAKSLDNILSKSR